MVSAASASPGRAVKMLEATCRMLLDRYWRSIPRTAARESILPKWRALLITFRRWKTG